MNESQLYELLSRKQAAIEHADSFQKSTLELLRGLKDGSIAMDRLTVSTSGWTLGPAVTQREGQPETPEAAA